MSSRDSILKNIRKNNKSETAYPEIKIDGISYDNIVDVFSENLELAGGKSIHVTSEQNCTNIIADLFPAENITLLSFEESIKSNIDINKIQTGHALKDLDLTVIRAELGVAENGAIWLNPEQFKHRASLFICQHLIIILDKTKLVNNMHEAYEKIDFDKVEYGLFISGPSKTADIEQALVIGAHGPRSCSVLLV